MASPPNNQNLVGLPELSAPMVNPDDTIAIPWYRFLIALWQRTGASVVPVIGSVFPVLVGAVVDVYQTIGGITNYITTLMQFDSAGAPAQPQTLAASPFIYTATRGGTLVVFSGEIELSRDGGVTYYVVGLTGGAIPLLANDQVRVTWNEARPMVTWFPWAAG